MDRWGRRSAPNDAPSGWRRVTGRRGLRRGLSVLVLAVACAGLFALYFRQSLTADGWQNETYPSLDPQGLPLTIT